MLSSPVSDAVLFPPARPGAQLVGTALIFTTLPDLFLAVTMLSTQHCKMARRTEAPGSAYERGMWAYEKLGWGLLVSFAAFQHGLLPCTAMWTKSCSYTSLKTGTRGAARCFVWKHCSNNNIWPGPSLKGALIFLVKQFHRMHQMLFWSSDDGLREADIWVALSEICQHFVCCCFHGNGYQLREMASGFQNWM